MMGEATNFSEQRYSIQIIKLKIEYKQPNINNDSTEASAAVKQIENKQPNDFKSLNT